MNFNAMGQNITRIQLNHFKKKKPTYSGVWTERL